MFFFHFSSKAFLLIFFLLFNNLLKSLLWHINRNNESICFISTNTICVRKNRLYVYCCCCHVSLVTNRGNFSFIWCVLRERTLANIDFKWHDSHESFCWRLKFIITVYFGFEKIAAKWIENKKNQKEECLKNFNNEPNWNGFILMTMHFTEISNVTKAEKQKRKENW